MVGVDGGEISSSSVKYLSGSSTRGEFCSEFNRFPKKGRDFGSCDGSGVFALSFNMSLENDDLRNFGMNLGDLAGDPGDELPSNTPRLRLSLLLVFLSKESVASSTDDVDDVISRFLKKLFSFSQESAGVVGTEKFWKLNFGIFCCVVLGRLPEEIFRLKFDVNLRDVGLSRMGPTLDPLLPSLKGESSESIVHSLPKDSTDLDGKKVSDSVVPDLLPSGYSISKYKSSSDPFCFSLFSINSCLQKKLDDFLSAI